MFANFFNSSGVNAKFYIPSTLVDFFRTLSVQTENDVSLFDRGDGVQARFIPEILDEISRNSKKNIIWGFEEPENSYEAKNVRKLKEDFVRKYSKRYQLFITTHTMELLALKREFTKAEKLILNDKKFKTENKRLEALNKLQLHNKSTDISIYRVWKKDGSSHITRFNESNAAWEELCDDLGIINEARIIETLQEKIQEQIITINRSSLDISKQKIVVEEIRNDYLFCLSKLESAEDRIQEFLKPILIVEDTYETIYKIAYLKCHNISFSKDNLQDIFDKNAPFTIRRSSGAGSVRGFLSMENTDGYVDKKVVGLFDYDKEGCENFYLLKRNAGGVWNSEILGDKRTGYYRKRKGHPCFYALLIPIPTRLDAITSDVKDGVFTSFVEIENLIDESKLIELKCVTETPVLNIKYFKIKNDIKAKSFEIFADVEKKYFSDFIPLFNKIVELFNIK